jgi:CHAD domain-containing protein
MSRRAAMSGSRDVTVADGDPEGVHQMRVGIRRSRRRKVFTAALKEIQSGLGRLNDMQVHGRLAHSLCSRQTPSCKADRKGMKTPV